MTEKGIELIKSFEGFRSDAYWDATGKVWTIGYGATFYMDGTKVAKGDKITKEEAAKLLEKMVSEKFEKYVRQYVTSDINPNQSDALTSFVYNCGPGNLKRSNLLKKVNARPSDPSIRDEFAKWTKSGGQVLAGLTRRRKAEADLYFTPYVAEPESSDSEEKKNEIAPESDTASSAAPAAEPQHGTENTGGKTVVKEEKKRRIPLHERFWRWIISIFWRD